MADDTSTIENKDNVAYEYGPQRPFEYHDQDLTKTPKYLSNFSKKIVMDLNWVAEHYTGHAIHIFTVNDDDRCPKCTNLATGEKMFSSCPVCHGTGYIENWGYLGRYFALTDFSPAMNVATETGNTENTGGRKDTVTVIGSPLLHDQDLIFFEDKRELYKIFDTEPLLVMLRGDIITQLAYVSLVDYGQNEYKCLEKLPTKFKDILKPIKRKSIDGITYRK